MDNHDHDEEEDETFHFQNENKTGNLLFKKKIQFNFHC